MTTPQRSEPPGPSGLDLSPEGWVKFVTDPNYKKPAQWAMLAEAEIAGRIMVTKEIIPASGYAHIIEHWAPKFHEVNFISPSVASYERLRRAVLDIPAEKRGDDIQAALDAIDNAEPAKKSAADYKAERDHHIARLRDAYEAIGAADYEAGVQGPDLDCYADGHSQDLAEMIKERLAKIRNAILETTMEQKSDTDGLPCWCKLNGGNFHNQHSQRCLKLRELVQELER